MRTEDIQQENISPSRNNTPEPKIVTVLEKLIPILDELKGELKNIQPKDRNLGRDEPSGRQIPRMKMLEIIAFILSIIAALLTIVQTFLMFFGMFGNQL